MNTLETVKQLNTALDTREAAIREAENRFAGTVPLSFVSAKARDELGTNLFTLKNNIAALTVTLLAERLRLSGFAVNGQPDPELWRLFQRLDLDADADTVHTDALALGCSYVSVWAADGAPVAVPEHASQVIHRVDPVTRAVSVALKRWTQDNRAFAVLYEPARLTFLQSNSNVPDVGDGYAVGTIPSTGWTVTEVLPNPLGVVPVVPFVNAGRLTAPYGVSEMAPVADLQDALTKITLDMMLASEAAARPRRWVTGIEIPTDADGNPVDVWAGGNNTAMSEAPESRFGQFQATDLQAYENASQLIIKQIAAIAGLPPHALLIDSSQAVSADAIRSAEAGLVAKAENRQKIFGKSWSQVARLVVAVRDGVPVNSVDVEPIWADAGSRSIAQEADAAVKEFSSGLLSREGALARIGLSPNEIQTEMQRAAAQAVLANVVNGGQP